MAMQPDVELKALVRNTFIHIESPNKTRELRPFACLGQQMGSWDVYGAISASRAGQDNSYLVEDDHIRIKKRYA